VLDSATPAARRVNTPAARVTVKNGRAIVTVENDARVAGLFQPGAARDRVKFNIIAGIYPGAAPATVARVFGPHAFNCHLVPYQKM
jgi:hypothetical protein